MEIIAYIQEGHIFGKRLQNVIEPIGPEVWDRVFHKVEDLWHYLTQAANTPDIAILLAMTCQELSDIISIRQLLQDTNIIIILPDRTEDTFALGCQLYPRFISFADGDFADVLSVLMKMIRHLGRRKRG